jgi:hypothetical protein
MANADPQELAYAAEIARLEQRVAAAREEASELEAQLDWWIKGRNLYGSNQSPEVEADHGKPTLAKAIVHVMEENRTAAWETGEIMAGLRSRGWMPTGVSAEHTVRSRLAKMARGDDAVLGRVQHGTYALREFMEEP